MPMTYDQLIESDEFIALPHETKNELLNEYGYDSLPEPADPVEPERAWYEYVTDPLIAAGQGVIGLGSSAVGLVDLFTPGDLQGTLEETTGYDPQYSTDFLEGYLSESQKNSNKDITNAEGFGNTVLEYIKNPSAIGQELMKSAPSMLAGGAVAKSLPVGMSLLSRAAIGEGAVAAGGQQSELTEQLGRETTIKEKAHALATGMTTASINRLGGTLAKKLGIADIDSWLAGQTGVAKKGTILGRIAAGGITEGVIEEMPQSAVEQLLQNSALDKPLMDGVAKAAGTGFVVGGMIGSGFNAISSPSPADVAVAAETQATELENTTDADGFKSVKNVVAANEIRKSATGMLGQFQSVDEQIQDVIVDERISGITSDINNIPVTRGIPDQIVTPAPAENIYDVQNRSRIAAEGRQSTTNLGFTPVIKPVSQPVMNPAPAAAANTKNQSVQQSQEETGQQGNKSVTPKEQQATESGFDPLAFILNDKEAMGKSNALMDETLANERGMSVEEMKADNLKISTDNLKKAKANHGKLVTLLKEQIAGLKEENKKSKDTIKDWESREYKSSNGTYKGKDMYGQDAGNRSFDGANERRRQGVIASNNRSIKENNELIAELNEKLAYPEGKLREAQEAYEYSKNDVSVQQSQEETGQQGNKSVTPKEQQATSNPKAAQAEKADNIVTHEPTTNPVVEMLNQDKKTPEADFKTAVDEIVKDKKTAAAVKSVIDARARSLGMTTADYIESRGIKLIAGSKALDEKTRQANKGAVDLSKEGQAIIHAFETADASTILHELGHIFRRDLQGSDLTAVENWAGVKDGVWTRAAEEKFARGWENYLATGQAPITGLQKAFDSIKKAMMSVYESITGSDIDVKVSSEVRAVFDKLLTPDSVWSTDVATAEKQGVIITDGTASILYSAKSLPASIKALQKFNDKHKVFSETKLKKYFKDLQSVSSMVLRDPARLDFVANDSYTALKKNSDKYYKKSLDFSTICMKRLALVSTIEDIQVKLGRGLLPAELDEVRNALKDKGVVVSCGACYVDSTRIKSGLAIERFILANPQWKELKKHFLSQEGFDYLQKNHADAYKAFNAYTAPQLIKTSESRTEYKGEILKLPKSAINTFNSKAGLRWQSWSDFEAVHMLDAMQAVVDHSAVGLKGHTYTKVPEMVESFGHTGLMINMSLIASGNGLNTDGTLAFDPIEGMPIEDAMRLRDNFTNTAGTILIGINDAHIRAAMADNRIDYLIPYHVSGLNADFRNSRGMSSWEDYTNTQSHKVNDSKKLAKAGGIEEFDNKYHQLKWFDKNKTGDQNAQTYLEMCDEYGITPLFDKFKNESGYWKVLIDKKMYNNQGSYIEQGVVTPRYDMKYIEKMLKDYTPVRPKPDQETSDLFVEGLPKELTKEELKTGTQIAIEKNNTNITNDIKEKIANGVSAEKMIADGATKKSLSTELTNGYSYIFELKKANISFPGDYTNLMNEYESAKATSNGILFQEKPSVTGIESPEFKQWFGNIDMTEFRDQDDFVEKLYKRSRRKQANFKRSIAKRMGGKYTAKAKVPENIAHYMGDYGSKLSFPDGDVYLGASSENHVIYVSNIAVTTPGSGLGTKFMETLKTVADETAQDISIYKVTNKKFFRKFNWLEETDGAGDFTYKNSGTFIGVSKLADIWEKQNPDILFQTDEKIDKQSQRGVDLNKDVTGRVDKNITGDTNENTINTDNQRPGFRKTIAPLTGRDLASKERELRKADFYSNYDEWQGENTERGRRSILASDVPAGRGKLPTDVAQKNFDKWFKGSLAVDTDGKPMVWFHGSPTFGVASDPKSWTFDQTRRGENVGHTFTGLGMTFTPSYEMARTAARGGQVTGVNLQIRNPYVLNESDIQKLSRYSKNDTHTAKAEAFAKRKMELGDHDSVYNPETGFIYVPESVQSKEIRNTGAYSEDNPDILFQTAEYNDVVDEMGKDAWKNATTNLTEEQFYTVRTPSFEDWFGDSQVLDENGDPLIVYHGTSATSEDGFAFDYNKIGQQGRSEGTGFYFTNNKKIAKSYAKNGIVISAYMKLEKPMSFDEKSLSLSYAKKLIRRITKLEGGNVGDGFLSNYGDVEYDGLNNIINDAASSLADEDTLLDQMGGLAGAGVSPDIINQAVIDVTGFDGVVTNGFSNRGKETDKIYVAFKPTQVKSINNTGAYSEDNPDILFQTAEATRRSEGFMGRIAPYINLTTEQRDKLSTRLWDRLTPVKRIQGRVARRLQESEDYLLHRRVSGRMSADEVTILKKTVIDPLLKTMADANISIKDAGDYMWTDHASERNLQMKRVRAMGFIRNITNAMTDSEKSEFDDLIFDAKHNSELTLAEVDDKRDGYIDIMDSMQDRISEWEMKIEDQRASAQTEHQLKLLKNAEQRLEIRKKTIDTWEDVKDRLSGLTDEQAEARKSELDSPEMRKIADAWRRINAGALKQNLEAGEITQEEYDAINRPYKKHVPLYREDQDFENPKTPVGTQALGAIGSPIKTAYGSTSAVENVIPHIVDRAQAAIERKHRLDGTKILYDMAMNNPEMGLSISKQPTTVGYDKDGNLIRQPDFVLKPNQWRMKVDGETHLLEVDPADKEGMRFVESLLPKISDLGWVLNGTRKINQMLAKLNTTYNPEFVISNFVRDLQMAGVMLEDTEGAKGAQKQVIKNVSSAIKGIYNTETGKPSGEWGKWWEDMKKNGGKISFLESYATIEDLAKKLETDLAYVKGEKSAIKTKGKATLEWIEAMNTSVENGVRLSTYRYLVETAGQSRKLAAKNVANLTVDFNRSGTWGPVANSLYMFANAGVIGNARMIQALGKSRAVRKLAAGVVGVGMIQGVLSVIMGGYDDDGESYYDKLRRSKPSLFERNMIWMLPGTKGDYIRFPLAYGLNVLYKFGEEMATAVRSPQGYSPMKGAMALTTTAMNAFNPVASSTILQTLSPTVTDPIIQSYENKNWFGGDMSPAPNPYGLNKPDSERYWKSVNPAAKGIARTLNTLTGGDRIEGGLIDVTPATIENVWSTFTGATGRFVTDVATLPFKVISGNAGVNDVPFVRKLAGSASENVDSTIYRENKDRVEILSRRYDIAETDAERRKIQKDSLFSMIEATDSAEKQLRSLRKTLRTAEDAGRESSVERINDQIREFQRRYNRKFNRIVD